MGHETKELLQDMEGVEVVSLHFEGLVAVRDGKFYISHSNREFRPTPAEIRVLWGEYFEQEMGPMDQVMRDLEAEFGGSVR